LGCFLFGSFSPPPPPPFVIDGGRYLFKLDLGPGANFFYPPLPPYFFFIAHCSLKVHLFTIGSPNLFLAFTLFVGLGGPKRTEKKKKKVGHGGGVPRGFPQPPPFKTHQPPPKTNPPPTHFNQGKGIHRWVLGNRFFFFLYFIFLYLFFSPKPIVFFSPTPFGLHFFTRNWHTPRDALYYLNNFFFFPLFVFFAFLGPPSFFPNHKNWMFFFSPPQFGVWGWKWGEGYPQLRLFFFFLFCFFPTIFPPRLFPSPEKTAFWFHLGGRFVFSPGGKEGGGPFLFPLAIFFFWGTPTKNPPPWGFWFSPPRYLIF